MKDTIDENIKFNIMIELQGLKARMDVFENHMKELIKALVKDAVDEQLKDIRKIAKTLNKIDYSQYSDCGIKK